MELWIKVRDYEFSRHAIDEYEIDALKAIGDKFGYNTKIVTNAVIFKEEIMVLVSNLIYYGKFLVASDVLKFASIIINSDEWQIIRGQCEGDEQV